MQCARAFGATIMQRDDPVNEPPLHRKVDKFYYERVAEAEAAVEKWHTINIPAAIIAMGAEIVATRKHNIEYRRKRDLTRSRYESMLAQVSLWEPPTPDHAEMKKFMRDQLTSSIEWDCGDYSTPEFDGTVHEWLAAKREQAAKDLEYASESLAKQEELAAGANAWIDALYVSLGEQYPD